MLGIFTAQALANHFLGAQESSGYGGHPPDCGESFKGPYRGLGEGYEKRPFSSMFASTFAVTISPFYIISTTSECADAALARAERAQLRFIASNTDVLTRQIAQGTGDHLRSLASLMGCAPKVYPEFSRLTQQNFQALLPPQETGLLEFHGRLKQTIRLSPTLTGSCVLLS